MSETTIRYNGVEIKSVLTESIDQEVVKDSTGVDPIYVRVRVAVRGIVHLSQNANLMGLKVPGDLATGVNSVIDDLLQPRRPFSMLINGLPMFDVVPGMVRPGLSAAQAPLNRTDCNHGPITTVRFLEVVSGNTMRIEFTCTMHLPYCDQTGQSPGGIISFRFWIAEDIDCTTWTTRRIYSGRVRVAHMGINVLTAFRNNIRFPPLQRSFVRKAISLHQSPNGLEMDFTVVDQEMWSTRQLRY